MDEDGDSDASSLLRHLRQAGFSDPTILKTGLFTADLRPLWQGRYVFPYFDVDGEPVYAIARVTGGERGGADGGEGHPADFMSGKYAKPAHTKEYVSLSEPIYGLDTLRSDEPVLITEGMPDAVSAHEDGYACLSPVTRQFKNSDYKSLLDALDAHDVERVYVVQDAEEATSDHVDEREGWRALSHPQRSSGLAGALTTAALLAKHGVDARVGDLPSPSGRKGILATSSVR
ncbi:hypothetical protein [Halorarum salinum]|uniref:hypothetical protein n=1 Tax=Halorarum salinum TaxID=2743089 RepID=UPI001FE7367C|nr:hypothetical protein [Halobaculum salinum]